MSKRIEFCGAFNGTVTVRDGETLAQLYDRLNDALQSALDRSCKRLDVAIEVDHADLQAHYFLSGDGSWSHRSR